MTLFHLREGKTLDVVMDELQQKFNYYNDTQFSIFFPGSEGPSKMSKLMDELRGNISDIAGYKVTRVEDYEKGIAKNADGTTEKLTLPVSNVLKFFLGEDIMISIRPSGTEPKCKFYYGTNAKDKEEVKTLPSKLHEDLLKKIGLK